MDDNKVKTAEVNQQEGTKTIFDVRAIYTSLILNWTWFVASALICLACAYLYLRYTTPVYQAYAKLLIKEEQSGRRGNSIQNSSNLGVISNSYFSYAGTKCCKRLKTICDVHNRRQI